jgi:hypothetical protein
VQELDNPKANFTFEYGRPNEAAWVATIHERRARENDGSLSTQSNHNFIITAPPQLMVARRYHTRYLTRL